MAKYLKLFNNHEDYLNFKKTDDFILPNVSHCVQENEVHYNPIPDPYNGKAYVDLGLTSGTKWAKMNVGASSEKKAGLYFAWGETTGYTASQVGNGDGQKAFSWSDYRWTDDGSSTMSKYNKSDNKTHLELTDDAAHVNWGGDWHMPTKEQYIELLKETKNGVVTDAGAFIEYAWDDNDGHSTETETTVTISGWNTPGFLFFKKTYGSVTDAISAQDYLFIPAAGICGEGGVVDNGGMVWTSTLNSEDVTEAWHFSFSSDTVVYVVAKPIASVSSFGGYRCLGFSVRGVVGQITVVQPT